MEKLRMEIAILKKCDHENVVKLYEVLDNPDSTKIYLSKFITVITTHTLPPSPFFFSFFGLFSRQMIILGFCFPW